MSEQSKLDRTYMPAPNVLKRYGITDTTLDRWLDDEALGMPRPMYIGRNRYFDVAELEAWETSRPRRRAIGRAPDAKPQKNAAA